MTSFKEKGAVATNSHEACLELPTLNPQQPVPIHIYTNNLGALGGGRSLPSGAHLGRPDKQPSGSLVGVREAEGQTRPSALLEASSVSQQEIHVSPVFPEESKGGSMRRDGQ